jgi:LPS O-antigen subunit length determinant protein (WzzB/FepE family)
MENEKLVNEYINSLTLKVNELQQENLLLKARINLQTAELEEEKMALKLELQQTKDKLVKQESTPKVKTEAPAEKPAIPAFTSGSYSNSEDTAPKPKGPKPMIKAPKPKGYNANVDGPRDLIPNPKLEDYSEATN